MYCFSIGISLTGENHSKPRPQNMILVPLTAPLQNFQQAPPSFLYIEHGLTRIVPKVEFNFEVILYVINFVF